jgi:hypothetical protein
MTASRPFSKALLSMGINHQKNIPRRRHNRVPRVVILEAAMSDEPKKPSSDLEKLAEELVESINEEPAMEFGQADTTPAAPTKDDSK